MMRTYCTYNLGHNPKELPRVVYILYGRDILLGTITQTNTITLYNTKQKPILYLPSKFIHFNCNAGVYVLVAKLCKYESIPFMVPSSTILRTLPSSGIITYIFTVCNDRKKFAS